MPVFMRIFLLVMGLHLQGAPAGAQTAGGDKGSGLPIPRYVSLKSDRVNVRKGPGFDYPIAWTYQRAGLPVEVLKEFENWRQVRDSDGTEGWVLQNLLSGRRTALIAPWEAQTTGSATAKPLATMLQQEASETSSVVAMIEPGVLATVLSCDKTWCRVSIAEQRGYITQSKLWGVYKDEPVQ